jgi:hypothetical protein
MADNPSFPFQSPDEKSGGFPLQSGPRITLAEAFIIIL